MENEQAQFLRSKAVGQQTQPMATTRRKTTTARFFAVQFRFGFSSLVLSCGSILIKTLPPTTGQVFKGDI